jgi:hypothetical protein
LGYLPSEMLVCWDYALGPREVVLRQIIEVGEIAARGAGVGCVRNLREQGTGAF